ncbi:hypothetical protein TNIN_76242 [Trichonephila inaurata madagascariensis]|uniref:Uncharacterized protein n=1 Tax=Trichonephila inaurata madagascariensis TaxID=2747483 RepID=A0A8X6WLG2_9ARAC|nr:hypothetical protein TNIN_76242 [Trichonephila inaurata madagascariensis]
MFRNWHHESTDQSYCLEQLALYTNSSFFHTFLPSKLKSMYSDEETDTETEVDSTDSTEPMGVNIHEVGAEGRKCASKGTMTMTFSLPPMELYRKPYSQDLYDKIQKCIDGQFAVNTFLFPVTKNSYMQAVFAFYRSCSRIKINLKGGRIICRKFPSQSTGRKGAPNKKPSFLCTRRKIPSKKRKTKASTMKISLERPEFPFKVALYNKNLEFLKLKENFNVQKKMVSDLFSKNILLHEQLDRKVAEFRSLQAEYVQYRKEAEKKDEEIKHFKQLYESLEEKMDHLQIKNEILRNKNEQIKTLVERKVPENSDKSPIVHSAKLTIKDDEVAHRKGEMKELEKKFEMLEERVNEKYIPDDDDSLHASKEIPDSSSVST